MPQFNETELTTAVIKSFEEVEDPRVKYLMEELVKSLHDYVGRTNLTFGEWEYAIDFLTRVGQKCTPSRQEFILLSDVLGVSMLVDAVNHREREGATETTVLGPFYVGEHKAMPHGTDISPNLAGERMFVQGRVTDLSGKPLANVPVDVWHADDDGWYDSQKPDYETQGLSDSDRWSGRANDPGAAAPSDAAGACAFPGQCTRPRAFGHSRLHRRRQVYRFRRRVRGEERADFESRKAQRSGDARWQARAGAVVFDEL
jgi:protocatechuate 3,4-dioxygenase beta subunit